MREIRSTIVAALMAAVASLAAADRAEAVVLASDDFAADGGGIGFDTNDTWGNLSNGVSDTSVASPAFRTFASPLSPFDSPTGSIFVTFDINANSPDGFAGVSFFADENDGSTETFFIGVPGGFDYGINTLGAGTIGTNIVADSQVRTLIAEVEFGAEDDTYRFWVDNFNAAAPSGELMIDGFLIESEWQAVRIASDTGGGTTIEVDNLVIATTAADVGLVTVAETVVSVDRSTGEITLSTSSGSLANVVEYSLGSFGGGLDPAGWTPIDGRLDSPDGDGTLDDDDWLAQAGAANALGEQVVSETPGDGATVTTTGVNLGAAWNRSPIEDVVASVVINDGGVLRPLLIDVVYTGDAIVSGDLDGDGDIDPQDWALFKQGQGAVNNTLSAVEAYQLGDLDGDFQHDLDDFDLFAEAFDAANGMGSLAALIAGAPEPTSAGLAIAAMGLLSGAARRRY
ncbi:MAG: hypothetical protein AAGB00_02405 [Planctomycetota bacterium]